MAGTGLAARSGRAVSSFAGTTTWPGGFCVIPDTLGRGGRRGIASPGSPASLDRYPAATAERRPRGDRRNLGFDNAAAIAAALLDGPVAITGTASLCLTGPSPALDRLAVLNAVAALLPYGFRAVLSGSTAVDNTVAHRMRLILADYAKDGQQAAPLRGAPVTPRSALARDYLTMLLDKKRWDGLDAVVASCRTRRARAVRPRGYGTEEILDGLNRHGHKISAARKDVESLEFVACLLAQRAVAGGRDVA